MEARGKNAFVIWLEDDGQAGGFACRGRVEHVGSAVRASFASSEELLRFMESALRGKLAERDVEFT
jgi:hypothetical protein